MFLPRDMSTDRRSITRCVELWDRRLELSELGGGRLKQAKIRAMLCPVLVMFHDTARVDSYTSAVNCFKGIACNHRSDERLMSSF